MRPSNRPAVLRQIFNDHLKAIKNPQKVLDYPHTDHEALARRMVQEYPKLFSEARIKRAVAEGQRGGAPRRLRVVPAERRLRYILRRLEKGPTARELRAGFLSDEYKGEAAALAELLGAESGLANNALQGFHKGLRLKRIKGDIPDKLNARFNIAAPYSALIPGNPLQVVTAEDWKYFDDKINAAKDRYAITHRGRTIGFVTGTPEGRDYLITGLYVERPFRRRYVTQWALGQMIPKAAKTVNRVITSDMITNTESLARKLMAAHRHGGDGLAGLEHVMPLISGIEIVPSDVVTFNGKVVRVNKRGEAVKRGGKPFRPNNLVIKLKR